MRAPDAQILNYGATTAFTASEAAWPGTQTQKETAAAAERFEGITPVRMAAAFFVVLLHTTYQGLKNAPPQVSEAVRTLNDIGWMVPFFFVLSGFLFARSVQAKSDAKVASQCGKSARRALTLWLAWSFLYLLDGPLKALLHGDLHSAMLYYQEKFSSAWPSVLWIGPCYHLWFLASLLMVWLLLSAAGKVMPGSLRTLVNNGSARPLLCTAGLAAAAGFAASRVVLLPVSAAAQALEVLVVHAALPLTFVLIGAALWHHRAWLARPMVIGGFFCVGGMVVWAQLASGFGLNGPGPRSLSAGGLVLAIAALGLGLRLPVKQPLPAAWNVSAGIYCVHMIVVTRMGKIFARMEHWSASLLLAVAAFAVSLLISLVLSRFSLTARLVK